VQHFFAQSRSFVTGLIRKLPTERWTAWIAFGLAAAVVAGVVVRYAVDVPLHDQFELTPSLERLFSGRASWADFNAQNNEHRILVPRTIWLAMAWLTRFDVRAQLIPVFLAIVLTNWIVFWIAQRMSAENPLPRAAWWLLAALLFSLRQYECLLWGATLTIVGTAAFVTCALYLLWRSETSGGRYLLAVPAAAAASFCSGGGLLAWPLGALCIGWQRLPLVYKVRRLTVWSVAALAVMLIYFSDYRRQVNPWPSGLWFLAHNLRGAVNYSFIYLGSPLAASPLQACLAGGAVAAMALTILWRAARDASFRRAAAPAIALLLFVLASGALVLYARLGLGAEQAFASRYTSISKLALGAILLAGAALRSRSRMHSLAYSGVLLLMAVGLLSGAWQSLRAIQADYQSRLQARQSMLCFESAADSQLSPVLYPDPNRVRYDARILRHYRLSLFRAGEPECPHVFRK
jgi:hypothetical protein